MTFVRIRTIKGKQYRYEETRWREGEKVRSRSKCLGPVTGGSSGIGGDYVPDSIRLRRKQERLHYIDFDALERQLKEDMEREDARHEAHLARLYLDFGLTLGPAVPVPVEKPPSKVDLLRSPVANPESLAEGEKEAPPEGEADVSETPDQSPASTP